VEQVYEKLYRLEGWFSESTTLSGWFADDFADITGEQSYDVTKNAVYTVETVSTTTTNAQYFVADENTATLSASYSVTTNTDITKSASYAVVASTDIVTSASYAVTFGTTITQNAAYVVLSSLDVTKSASYAVETTVDTTLASDYDVTFSTDILLSSAYSVVGSQDITKSAQYSVLFTTNTVTAGGVATSWTNPGTVVSDPVNIVGSRVWSNPSNILSSNNTYATVSMTDVQTSQYLKATNFGFSIPLNAIIKGIEVQIEARASSSSWFISDIKLVKESAPQYRTNHIAGDYTLSDMYNSVGGATDMWSDQLNPIAINSSTFGVAFAMEGVTSFSSTISVDHAQMRVYYDSVNVPDQTIPSLYVVASNKSTTKSAQYKVLSSSSTTKTTSYSVATTATTSLQSEYSVVIGVDVDITISSTYCVAASNDETNQSTYLVGSPSSTTVTSRYAVAANSSLAVDSQYVVSKFRLVVKKIFIADAWQSYPIKVKRDGSWVDSPVRWKQE